MKGLKIGVLASGEEITEGDTLEIDGKTVIVKYHPYNAAFVLIEGEKKFMFNWTDVCKAKIIRK